MASILGTTNLSLYTIPAGWVMAMAPHFYATRALGGKFDKSQPRTYTTTVSQDQALDKATKNKIIRAEGAQQNGHENLGLFASAVVAGNVAGLSNTALNTLSLGYLASRALYNILYITNEDSTASNARSVTFVAGVGMIMTLFVKSGNLMRERLLAGAF